MDAPDRRTREAICHQLERRTRPRPLRASEAARVAPDQLASVRSFEVNPVRAERLGFEIEAEDAAQALYAFDRNPGTSFENRGVLKFGIPEGTKQYTLLLKLPAEGAVTVRQLAPTARRLPGQR